MLGEDIDILLQIKKVSKSDLARMMKVSRQNIYSRFQRDGFRPDDVKFILDKLNIELKCTYIDKETNDIIYQSKI